MQESIANRFLVDLALASNKSRLLHLDSLGIPLAGKSVLEVGAGIGLLTGYLESKCCKVLSTDGRPENVATMKKLFPWRTVDVVDLDSISTPTELGKFDIVFCYGVLYHLKEPEKALTALSAVCKDMILLESKTSVGESGKYPQKESGLVDQALHGIGCRPTKEWITGILGKHFEFVYVPVNTAQFLHDDRFVCVGTRKPMELEKLEAIEMEGAL